MLFLPEKKATSYPTAAEEPLFWHEWQCRVLALFFHKGVTADQPMHLRTQGESLNLPSALVCGSHCEICASFFFEDLWVCYVATDKTLNWPDFHRYNSSLWRRTFEVKPRLTVSIVGLSMRKIKIFASDKKTCD